MKKQILSVVSILLFGISIVSAQTSVSTDSAKTISGGIINGKAKSLPPPAFPAAARAVRASGAVSVQVTIDEEGKVISASAVSGHPLLRQAAEQAARQAEFNPTQLSGQPVKVTGVIVYNFVAEKTSWVKVGYDLMNVQHAPSLVFLNTFAIAEVFQTDWTTEREQLQKLGEIKQTEAAGNFPPVVTSERKISENSEKKPDGTTVKKIIIERSVKKSDSQTDSEQIAISQSLIASLQARLASDELSLWQFNTGLSLSEALSQLRFSNERQRVLGALRNQIGSAPSGISAEYVSELQKILTILEKPTPVAEDRHQTMQIMQKLFRNQ